MADKTLEKIKITEKMENEYPVMTKRFKQLQREQYELVCKKQHD